MKKVLRRAAVVLSPFVLLGASLAPLSPTASAATGPGLQPLNFQANANLVLQGDGNSISGMASWTPAYGFTEKCSVRLNLGAILLKGSLDNRFVALDYQAFVGYRLFGPLYLEAGGGAQTWISNGGTKAALSGNAAWIFDNKILGFMDRIFAGYSRVFQDIGANEINAGIGLSF